MRLRKWRGGRAKDNSVLLYSVEVLFFSLKIKQFAHIFLKINFGIKCFTFTGKSWQNLLCFNTYQQPARKWSYCWILWLDPNVSRTKLRAFRDRSISMAANTSGQFYIKSKNSPLLPGFSSFPQVQFRNLLCCLFWKWWLRKYGSLEKYAELWSISQTHMQWW